MLRIILLSIAGFLSAGATTPPVQPRADYTVTLSRGSGGDWIANYRFSRVAPAWLFPRTYPDIDGRPWRQRSWQVETPSVRLEQRGRYDVLTADGPALTTVRIRVRPFTEALRADYTPVLSFSDGALAHYSNHFEVAPLASLAAARSLPVNLNDVAGLGDASGRLIVRDPGKRLLLEGRVTRSEISTPLGDRGVYIYSGDAPIVETETLAAVVDPGLPVWARTELEVFTPRLLALYAERLGPSKEGRPTVFAAWGGADARVQSMSGSTLPNLIVMTLSGKGYVQPSASTQDRMRWFLGHEAAHFWLGQVVRYRRREESWITEGGADVLAIRALERLQPGYDGRVERQREVDDCMKMIGPAKPLNGATERGDHRVSYACGAVLLMAAESAMRRRDPTADALSFWRILLDRNRVDGVVDAAEWLAAFQIATDDDRLTGSVRGFVDTGTNDPTAFVAALFDATGVEHTRDGSTLRLR